MFLLQKSAALPKQLPPDVKDIKTLKQINLNNTNFSQVNVVKEDTNDEYDVRLARSCNVAKCKWVMDSATYMHIH